MALMDRIVNAQASYRWAKNYEYRVTCRANNQALRNLTYHEPFYPNVYVYWSTCC